MKKTVLIIAVCHLTAAAAGAELSIGGYYKNEMVTLNDKDGRVLSADVNKLRLKVDHGLSETVHFHLEPEYVCLLNQASFALMDVSRFNEVVWDRTYVKVNFPQADLTVGKQRVAWGTGKVWNPTDVFNPFALTFAVAEEERRGVDAWWLQVPLGAASAVDAVVLTDAEIAGTKKGIRYRTNIHDFDLSASYVNFGDEGYQFGCDTSGELFDQGLYAEAAFVRPGPGAMSDKLVLGWDYTLENGVGLNAEYFYNGEGERLRDDYDWASYMSGEISQLGRDYLFFGVNKAFDEITQVSLSYMANLDDGSYVIYPVYARNVMQDLDLNLEAMFPGGSEGSEYNPGEGMDATGLAGSRIYFVKLRYSF